MSVNYISRQLTEEEFFKLVFEKGKSLSSEKKARSGVNNLEYFTQDKYKKSRFVVLKDLKEDLDKTQIQIWEASHTKHDVLVDPLETFTFKYTLDNSVS